MRSFENNILNTYGSKGKAWLAELPQLAQQASNVWGLTNLKPAENLSYNYVLYGLQKEKPVVLKLTLEPKRLNKEAQALKIFSEFGAVSLLAKTETALLLERIMPGRSLKTYLPKRKDEALYIICRLMKRLHQAPLTEGTVFPHIEDLLKTLDKEWNISKELIEKARHLKGTLLQQKQAPVLLHGDLHHSNILSDGVKWWAIDPQGVVGCPINEVWAFIIDPISDTQYVADYFRFDVKTVREWYFIHLMLMVCWNINDNHDPSFFLELAKKAYYLVQS